MSNITNAKQKPKFSVALATPSYQELIHNTLKDPDRAKRFIASITSAVAVNPALQECTPATILSGALLGESLNLSPSPQLGQFYLVPFDNKKEGVKKAQFILGYKGYVQLAIRSGYYKKLNVQEIKQGELIKYDFLNEEIEIKPVLDFEEREKLPTIGYYAMFEYHSGFRKAIYWTYEQMLSHADTYSMAFSKVAYKRLQNGEIAEKDKWKYSSFWYKDFDAMAKKTMLRQLISKWGIMSTELQKVYSMESESNDFGTVVGEDEGPIEYEEQEQQVAEVEKQQEESREQQKIEVITLDDLD